MRRDPPHGPEPEDPETGQPIEEIAGLREPVQPDFLDRVRNRIHRRMLALEVMDLTWRTPALVVLQWMLMLVDLLRGLRGEQGAERNG